MINKIESAQIIAVVAIVTAALRFLPFILFPEDRKLPKVLVYFSNVLPASIMGMLVVYCFRNINIVSYPHGLPELLALMVVSISYIWKRSILLSIAAGTIIYMILVQVIFI